MVKSVKKTKVLQSKPQQQALLQPSKSNLKSTRNHKSIKNPTALESELLESQLKLGFIRSDLRKSQFELSLPPPSPFAAQPQVQPDCIQPLSQLAPYMEPYLDLDPYLEPSQFEPLQPTVIPELYPSDYQDIMDQGDRGDSIEQREFDLFNNDENQFDSDYTQLLTQSQLLQSQSQSKILQLQSQPTQPHLVLPTQPQAQASTTPLLLLTNEQKQPQQLTLIPYISNPALEQTPTATTNKTFVNPTNYNKRIKQSLDNISNSNSNDNSADDIKVPAFITKLYTIVQDPTTDHMISWTLDGRSFIVYDSEQFAKVVLPLYFKHSNFSSFVRQLNMYHFIKIPNITAPFTLPPNEFKNEAFQKNSPKKLPKISRRKVSEPEKEILEEERRFGYSVVEVEGIVDEIGRLRGEMDAICREVAMVQMNNQALLHQSQTLTTSNHVQKETIEKILRFLGSVFSKPAGEVEPLRVHDVGEESFSEFMRGGIDFDAFFTDE